MPSLLHLVHRSTRDTALLLRLTRRLADSEPQQQGAGVLYERDVEVRQVQQGHTTAIQADKQCCRRNNVAGATVTAASVPWSHPQAYAPDSTGVTKHALQCIHMLGQGSP